MTEIAFKEIVTFSSETCPSCGIRFGVDLSVRTRWRTHGESFYCPNGHSQSYHDTEVTLLKKKLAQAERDKEFLRNNAASERAAREHTERRLYATQGARTKLRKRIKHGVCPCCQRTFQQLARHMKTQHPQYQPNGDD